MRRRILIDVVGRVLFAVCLFAGLGVLLIDLQREEPHKPAASQIAQIEVKNPLDAELLWCRHLGDEALRDKECLRAWSENLEQFLKKDPPEVFVRKPTKNISESSNLKSR
ncbi:MAG: hypothetical protein EB015_12355 [Methylocystaceae bacterium]|nr:hypothetical protein [Methylocystaceae bacterium]